MNRFLKKNWRVMPCFLVLLITACAHINRDSHDGPPDEVNFDANRIPDPTPRKEARSKYGNPASYHVMGKRYHVLTESAGYKAAGKASWYGRKFHGRRTSSGEIYDMFNMTAAHKTLPIPCYVKVKNLDNGKEAIVRVNDRGPFHPGRIIDLSFAAAKKLGVYPAGTANVVIETVLPDTSDSSVLFAKKTPATTPFAPATEPKKARTRARSVYVQMGAFSQKASAEKLAETLRGLNDHPVRITESKSPKTLYRVQIGPLVDLESAEALRLRLTRFTQQSSMIVDTFEPSLALEADAL